MSSRHGALECPQCDGAKLIAISPPDDEDLVIDRWDACGGFWLDPRELDAVRAMVLASDSAETADRALLVGAATQLVLAAMARLSLQAVHELVELSSGASRTARSSVVCSLRSGRSG